MTMNIAKMTRLPPVEIGYRIDQELPVIPFSLEVSHAGCAAAHAHPRGQLIFASYGSMRVVCGRDIWVVPPSQAVWVPPYVEHEVYFPGDVSLRNLFVDPAFTTDLFSQCTVLRVTPLLRELILKAVQVGDHYAVTGPGYRLMLVLIDEIRIARPTLLHLPFARDARLSKVMNAMLENPGDPRGLSEWAGVAGASARTLSRLFQLETGLSYGEWRKRLVLQKAVEKLGHGDHVTEVAFDLGYQSLSAFINMFRKNLGAPPMQFVRLKES